MKKIICIGECSLNVVLDAAGTARGTMPGGRIANAAAIMAQAGLKVLVASEAASDPVGDIVVAYLEKAGADITSIDRFTEGRTTLNVFVEPAPGAIDAFPSITRYEQYPEEAFDIIWPRIDPGDIVLFGGFYALDKRMRPRMQRLLSHAVERNAILVYLPGFLPQQEPRITRIMPQILENLEMANIVVARNKDLELIFGVKTPDDCYHDHIDFYCRSLVNVDNAHDRITYYAGKEMSSVNISPETSRTLLWNAGAVAGIVSAIFERDITAGNLENPDAELREAIIGAASKSADAAADTLTEPWQSIQ